MVTTNATLMLPARHSSAQASSVITITGIGDHDRPDWLITMTGIRSHRTIAEIVARLRCGTCHRPSVEVQLTLTDQDGATKAVRLPI